MTKFKFYCNRRNFPNFDLSSPKTVVNSVGDGPRARKRARAVEVEACALNSTAKWILRSRFSLVSGSMSANLNRSVLTY